MRPKNHLAVRVQLRAAPAAQANLLVLLLLAEQKVPPVAAPLLRVQVRKPRLVQTQLRVRHLVARLTLLQLLLLESRLPLAVLLLLLAVSKPLPLPVVMVQAKLPQLPPVELLLQRDRLMRKRAARLMPVLLLLL